MLRNLLEFSRRRQETLLHVAEAHSVDPTHSATNELPELELAAKVRRSALPLAAVVLSRGCLEAPDVVGVLDACREDALESDGPEDARLGGFKREDEEATEEGGRVTVVALSFREGIGKSRSVVTAAVIRAATVSRRCRLAETVGREGSKFAGVVPRVREAAVAALCFADAAEDVRLKDGGPGMALITEGEGEDDVLELASTGRAEGPLEDEFAVAAVGIVHTMRLSVKDGAEIVLPRTSTTTQIKARLDSARKFGEGKGWEVALVRPGETILDLWRSHGAARPGPKLHNFHPAQYDRSAIHRGENSTESPQFPQSVCAAFASVRTRPRTAFRTSTTAPTNKVLEPSAG
ncbi:hypothetical protein DFJ73DRAFT_964752 [Zopfochytrium polystomum]|nr:hypothetical protein DFJ73DRAFT_964752 [Zopfochytrium polystomum]